MKIGHELPDGVVIDYANFAWKVILWQDGLFECHRRASYEEAQVTQAAFQAATGLPGYSTPAACLARDAEELVVCKRCGRRLPAPPQAGDEQLCPWCVGIIYAP